MPIPAEGDIGTYDFALPPERIAAEPVTPRDASRLLVLDRADGSLTHAAFRDLPAFLPPGALLVANNTRVIPARVLVRKPTGGELEFLLLTPPARLSPRPAPTPGLTEAEAQGLLRGGKSLRPGDTVTLAPDLALTLLAKKSRGQVAVRLTYAGRLADILDRIGHMPLPPYIKRPDTRADRERYQTTHANPDKVGSAAAPTAGLHFTPELRRRLADAGFDWAEVTLTVGLGTFSPIRVQNLDDHVMHREWIELPEAAASAVRQAKKDGRPVVAVGTTSARTLEGAFAATGEIQAFEGQTDIFLRPGRPFQVIDALITNFHLPRSSLLIMVCALAGTGPVLDAYQAALDHGGYRFFSYGDAMLVR